MTQKLREHYPIYQICLTFNLSRTSFYDQKKTQINRNHLQLKSHVIEIFEDSRGSAGSRTICAHLRNRGIHVGRYKIRSLMKAAHLRSKQPPRHRYKKAMQHHVRIENKLNRQFNPVRRNQVWTGDITYVWIGRWIYLAVVLDLYKRCVMGVAMSTRADSELVSRALTMAVQLGRAPQGVMFHSDQGCQYTSESFRKVLARYQIEQSMSRRANCWDNAPTERLFRSYKSEWLPKSGYRSYQEAVKDAYQYFLGYYNHQRPHSYNAGLPPAVAEGR